MRTVGCGRRDALSTYYYGQCVLWALIRRVEASHQATARWKLSPNPNALRKENVDSHLASTGGELSTTSIPRRCTFMARESAAASYNQSDRAMMCAYCRRSVAYRCAMTASTANAPAHKMHHAVAGSNHLVAALHSGWISSPHPPEIPSGSKTVATGGR